MEESQELEDVVLVQRTLQGEREAFRGLIERYADRIFTVAYRMVGNLEDAEDLSQEAFLRAYRSLNHYKMEYRFSTWLYTIILNLIRNHLRHRRFSTLSLETLFRRRNKEKDSVEFPDLRENPQEDLIRNEERESISKAILKIPQPYREAFLLFHVNGLSYDDIAGATGIPVNTVKSRLHRARERLARLLKYRL